MIHEATLKDGDLFAAAVELDITPPVGTLLDGYAERHGPSKGVHDPLRGQLLLLRSAQAQVALISLDLLGVNPEFVQRVRQGIEEAIGVPAACVLIACSHTHSGPAGFLDDIPGLLSQPDPELQAAVAGKLVGAARWAQEILQPASAGVSRGRVEGIGRNRNDPEHGPADPEVLVLRIDDQHGSPLAVWMNYGCHPTVMGHDNLLISADYPGAARAALQRLFPQTVFLYANGASGDVSTRFLRRSQTFAEVERLGLLLAGEVLQCMAAAMPMAEVELAGRRQMVDLPFRRFPSPEDAAAEIARLQAQLGALKASGASHGEFRRVFTRVEGATAQHLLASTFAGRTHRPAQVQAIRIGGLLLVGLPGEPFTRTVLEIKARSAAATTAVVSYANDEAGYFPDAASAEQGTYEAMVSPFGPDVSEQLRDVALQLMSEV